MASLRDGLIPEIDGIRAIPEQLGVRTNIVQRVVRTWTGPGVNLGTYTDDVLEFHPLPKAREMMSGNEVNVGPITPNMLGVGYTYADVRPTMNSNQELFFLVIGNNGTRRYELVDIDTSRPFRMHLMLRTLERTRPF